MKTKTLVTITLLHFSAIVNAQFFNDLINTVGNIANSTVKVLTAPTEVLINTGKAITGNGSVNDIYKPIQQAVIQTGNTAVQTVGVLSAPQKFFMQKAQEYAQSIGGNTGAFIFDIGTFSNRYYTEFAQAGIANLNGVLQGQNPFQMVAIPLSAALRAGRERHIGNARPIPEDVKNALRPYFRETTLNRAKYTVGTIEITLPNFIGQGNKFMGNDGYAVVVDDVIVFNRQPGSFAAEGNWWAHEMTHVQQYENLGIETFAFNYLRDLGGSIEGEAQNNADRITGSTPNNSNNSSYALNAGSFDRSSSNIDENRNFNRNPEIYVSQCVFPNDRFGVMYLVTNYGRIIAVNPLNGQWQHIGYSTPPRLPNVAWSYDLPNANWSYPVGLDGNIYNIVPVYNNFGQIINRQWVPVGYVVKLSKNYR